MTRKKVTLAYISNDAERKASFRKRKKGLIKKVRELSTLCDIQACAIIYSPYDQEPEVWPSRSEALAVLARYRSLSDVDKSRKTVNQESFTRQRIKKAEDQLRRLRRENKRREMESFMFRCMAGMVSLQGFDLRDSAEMGWVVDQTLRDITARMDALKVNPAPPPPPQGGPTSLTVAAPAAPAAAPGGGNMDGYLLDHICGFGGGHDLGWALGPPLSHPLACGNGNESKPGPSNFQI